MASIFPPRAGADLAAFDFVPPAPDEAVYIKRAGVWTFLPVGTPGQVLGIGGGGALTYVTPAGSGDMLAAVYDPTGIAADAFDFANMDITAGAAGDLLIRGVSTWQRLPKAVDGRVLTTSGGGIAWLAPSGDMLAATYDPGGVVGDAFDIANMSIAGNVAGDLLGYSGASWVRIPAPGTAGQSIVSNAPGNVPTWQPETVGRGGIRALTLTRPTVSTVQIGVGACRSDDNFYDLETLAPLVVDLTASGAGGLDTGVEAASTWYDVWIIDGPADPVAGLLVIAGNAPTLPAGYNRKRRIGVVRNDAGSDLIDFIQIGNGHDRDYLWLSSGVSRILLAGGTATVPTAVDLSTLVPPSTQAARLTVINASGNRTLSLYQDTAGAVLEIISVESERSLLFPTNGSQAIAYSNSAGGGDANIAVRGFVDLLA